MGKGCTTPNPHPPTPHPTSFGARLVHRVFIHSDHMPWQLQHFLFVFSTKITTTQVPPFLQIYCHTSPHKIKCRIVVPNSKSLMSATLLLLIVETKITKLWAASYGKRSYQISLKSVTQAGREAPLHELYVLNPLCSPCDLCLKHLL